jgi:UDP-glucuronate decarboxylase
LHPQSENYVGNVNPIGPRACYDEGKRAAETLCADYQRLKRINARIVRIFIPHGPYMRDDDGRVVTNSIYKLLKAKPSLFMAMVNEHAHFVMLMILLRGLSG